MLKRVPTNSIKHSSSLNDCCDSLLSNRMSQPHFLPQILFLADRTARGIICYWPDNMVVCLSVCLWLNDTSTAKVSEQVKRKCPSRNTILQLSALYTDPEPSNSPLPKFPNEKISTSGIAPVNMLTTAIPDCTVRSAFSATAGLHVIAISYHVWVTGACMRSQYHIIISNHIPYHIIAHT